ncbi:Sodium/hydrogen exchanger family-domain-containing protein [Lactarius akahatsu]|uniref:Sodium/hydrogen exchanger family-domain-containing protein n=1 Tax=Lactarius akahatsu TaxID=416441 RepID=A0AAD4LKL5_9AGAM|nr:Sodium/hydrogen exchanger family-domain-containing protein [Lactarius akahatsu]
MAWTFLDTSRASVAYTLLGGFVAVTHLIVLKYNLASLVMIERLYMNEVVLGTGFGVLLGPHVLNIFDPRSWTGITDTLTQEVMRIVLTVGLFAIGVELPKRYMAEHAKSLLIMGGVDYDIWMGCIRHAAVIGGNFAVTNVPLPIRQLLTAESASNDGLEYPFLSISIYLTTEASRATAFEKWIIISWLYQVILGTTLSAIIGHLFSRILRFLQETGFIKRESYVAQYISLALFTAGATNSLGNDDLLAAFAAGCAISWDGHFDQQTEHDSFSAVLDLLLNCVSFIYIRAWLPFDKFHISEIGVTPWRLVFLVLIILVLRRIPSLLLLYKLIPEVADWREAMFWTFWSRAVFISTLAQSRLEAPQTQEDLLAIVLQPMVAFVVLGSILTHGLSIPFFAVGRHSLTISRSVLDTPKWPLWVDAGHPDAPEGADSDDTTILREGPHQNGQKRVEFPDLLDQTEPVPEDVNIPGRVAKIDGEGPSATTERTVITIEERVQIGL